MAFGALNNAVVAEQANCVGLKGVGGLLHKMATKIRPV